MTPDVQLSETASPPAPARAPQRGQDGARSSLRAAVRGMSYEQGSRALTPCGALQLKGAPAVQLKPSYLGNVPSNSYNRGSVERNSRGVHGRTEDGTGAAIELKNAVDGIIADSVSLRPLAKKLAKGATKLLGSGDGKKQTAGNSLSLLAHSLKSAGESWGQAALKAKQHYDKAKKYVDEFKKVHQQVRAFKQVLSQVAVEKFVDEPSLETAGMLTADLQEALNTAKQYVPNIPFVGDYINGVLGTPSVYLNALLGILGKYIRKIDQAADIASSGTATVGGIGTMRGEIALVFWRSFAHDRALAQYIYDNRKRNGNLEKLGRSTAITRLHFFMDEDREAKAADWKVFLRKFG